MKIRTRHFSLYAAVIIVMLMTVFVILQVSSAQVLAATEGLAAAAGKADSNSSVFTHQSITLQVDHRTRLPISDDDYSFVTFEADDPEILSVDSNGYVTALKQGVASVLAKAGKSIIDCCEVKTYLVPESISISRVAIELDPGETQQLISRVYPTDTIYDEVKWTSNDPSIASVENGLVRAYKAGKTYLTVESVNGLQAYCIVIVRPSVQSVDIVNKSVLLTVGSTMALKTDVLPENAANRELTWSSDTPKVVTVSNDGIIRAVAPGTALVTARTANQKSDTVKVTVESMITSIALDQHSMILGLGETAELRAAYAPADATKNTLYWKSSDNSVVTVENGVVTAKGVGRAQVTVGTLNGKTSTCAVEVKKAPELVTLEPKQFAIGVGENFRLKTILPENSHSRSITYQSSNESVCTVSANGTLTGKKTGYTTITCTLYNGVQTYAQVWVKAAPTAITLDHTSLEMNVGGTAKLASSVDASQASRMRNFTTSDSSVVTVTSKDGNGYLTAKGLGTATVTVTAFNGVKTSCVVSVRNLPSSVSFNYSSVEIPVDGSMKLLPVFPEKTYSAQLSYGSNNPTVCSIDANGIITGHQEGTATVTVRTSNGKYGYCTVNVKKGASSIMLYLKNRAVRPGESFKLYYYTNAGETAYGVTFTSGNDHVCTVDNYGNVKALAMGVTDVTVSTSNGKMSSCRVVVTNDAYILNQDYANRDPLYKNFPTVCQYPELPTGCEITALTMVLNFYDFCVDKCTLSDDYLEKGPAWSTDFHEAFAGEPRSTYSYGCYAPAIEKAANKYLIEQGSSLRAKELKNFEFDDLFHFTENNIPVLVWTTINLAQGYYTASWEANGKTVTWYACEHCMVLLGQVGDLVYTGDPTNGNITAYDKELFRKRYKELFSQSVVIQ